MVRVYEIICYQFLLVDHACRYSVTTTKILSFRLISRFLIILYLTLNSEMASNKLIAENLQ